MRRQPVRAPPAGARPTSATGASRTSSRSTTSSIRSSRWRHPRPLRESPFHAREQELGRVLPGGRGLGAAALVRRRTPACSSATRDPGARRLGGALLVADRRRGGARHPRRRRPVRHDVAQAPRGHRPGRVRLPRRADDQSRRPAGRHGRVHAPARRARRHPQRPHDRPAGRGPLPGRARTATSTSTGSGVIAPARRHRARSATSPPGPAASACGGRAPATSSRSLTDSDVSNEAFRYFQARELQLGNVPGHRAPALVRRRARLGAVHDGRHGPEAVGHALGGGPGARPHRRRPQRVRQPPAREGLPLVGHGHDHGARSVRGGAGVRGPHGQGRVRGPRGARRPQRGDAPPGDSCRSSSPTAAPSSWARSRSRSTAGRPGYVTSAAYGYSVGRADRVCLASRPTWRAPGRR